MQTSLISVEDIRHVLHQMQLDRDVLFTAILAGLLNDRLKHAPMQVVHRKRGLEYTYPILRFDIRKEVFGPDHSPHAARQVPAIQLIPVISQVDFEYEEHPVRAPGDRRDSLFVTMSRNEGYTAPPPTVEEKSTERTEAGGRPERQWRESGVRGFQSWDDVTLRECDFNVLIQTHVWLMEGFAEALKGSVKTTRRLSPSQVVFWRRHLDPGMFPNFPMFEVVAQVEPFIHTNERGYSQGLMDTIIQAQGNGYNGGSEEMYVHSSQLLTVSELQQWLIEPHQSHMSWNGQHRELKGWIVDEVLKKIPEVLQGRR